MSPLLGTGGDTPFDYRSGMIVVGVTGGIGMGKSACAQMLQQRGIHVVDTDQLARELVRPGQPALEEIKQEFGSSVLNETGELNRQKLAGVVFSDPAQRKRLESILHPQIRQAWIAQVRRWAAQGNRMAAIVIPLLFETGAQHDLDAVVCVACSEATQAGRLAHRGWSADEIHLRLSAQMAPARKMELADYVIWSEHSLRLHEDQLDRILQRLYVRS